MKTILEYACMVACEKFQHNGNLFSTAGFQSELARITNATPMITPQAAEAILLSIRGIERDSRCHWRCTFAGAPEVHP